LLSDLLFISGASFRLINKRAVDEASVYVEGIARDDGSRWKINVQATLDRRGRAAWCRDHESHFGFGNRAANGDVNVETASD
jgi:hypothetical protein